MAINRFATEKLLADNIAQVNQNISQTNQNVSQLETSKYDDVSYNAATGELTFKANNTDKKTVQSGNPNLVTIDQISKSNFDFICSKVVQDGLVDKGVIAANTTKSISLPSIYQIFISISPPQKGNWILLNLTGGGSWGLKISLLGDLFTYTLNLTNGPLIFDTKVPVGATGKDFIGLYQKDSGIVVITINGKSFTINDDRLIKQTYLQTRSSDNLNEINYLVYNRSLTPEEIQHNFQNLNNSPSISQLTTTNADGTKTPYKLATDSEHVVMRNGYNAEECLTGIYDMCKKEFVSTDGSAITIPNAIDKSKILSGEIKGQTIKNYCKTYRKGTLDRLNRYSYITSIVEPSKQYDFIVAIGNVDYGTSTVKALRLLYQKTDGSTIYVTCTSEVKSNTVYKVNTTMDALYNQGTISAYIQDDSVAKGMSVEVLYIAIVDGGISGVVNCEIPFGLSSTQAIIDNNGLKYTFYHPTETNTDGSRKVILLGSVGEAYDTFEIKEDGSGVLTENTKEITLDGSENWEVWNIGSQPQVVTKAFRILNVGSIQSDNTPNTICDKIKVANIQNDIYTKDEEAIRANLGNIYIRIDTSKLATQNVSGFKTWLQANPTTVRYQLATPIVTVIPKELVPTIALNDKTNILKVDSAVAPSEFKVVAPVNKMAEIEAKLTTTLSLLNTPSNMNLTANYVEDEYQKLLSESEGMM